MSQFRGGIPTLGLFFWGVSRANKTSALTLMALLFLFTSLSACRKHQNERSLSKRNRFIQQDAERAAREAEEAEKRRREEIAKQGQTPVPLPQPTTEPVSGILPAPQVSANTPTQLVRPMWSWSTADATMGSGVFRYRLDGAPDWQETSAVDFVPGADLSHGLHDFEVAERDKDGIWSASAVKTVNVATHSEIDPSQFYNPTVIDNPSSFYMVESMPPLRTSIHPRASISLTFSDIIVPSDIDDTTFAVVANGQPVYGSITGELTTTSPVRSTITFTPYTSFPVGVSVFILVSPALQDDDGGSIFGGNIFEYYVTAPLPGPIAATTVSFETSEHSGAPPWAFSGNGGVVDAIDQVGPTSGTKMAVITTGSSFLVSGTPAQNGSTGGPQISYMTLAINRPASAQFVAFDYDFVSAEFDGFVTTFDDVFQVSLSGSNGGHITKTIASVARVGIVDSDPVVFSPLGGSPQQTHWQLGDGSTPSVDRCTNCLSSRIDISSLEGNIIYLTFLVADVGDATYDTAAIVDRIRFE